MATDEKAGEYAEDLAASMLATTLGIEFNPELDWDEREQIFKMSGKIVRTANITQSAIGNKDGLWTTVFTAAVFINDDDLSFDLGKTAANDNRDSLQEEILRQSVQGQAKNVSAGDRLAQRNESAHKSGSLPANFIPSAKKGLS